MSDSSHYLLRHVTRFRYSAPISESMMELHMQPRSDGYQHCRTFTLSTSPRAHIFDHQDSLGNTVHHFDLPDQHTQLTITAEAVVEVDLPDPLPDRLGDTAWADLDAQTASDDYWDWLKPSQFAHPTVALRALMTERQIERGEDPLTTVRHLTAALHMAIDYVPQSTSVDSPIDEALGKRAGVCQDFAHIMIAAARLLGIPSRYVSGYLAQDRTAHDRSTPDATHAWVEVYLPPLGWVGFDPTNDLVTGMRHIRVALGRDYADVPPTHGIFRGRADTELAVAVAVIPSTATFPPDAARMRTLLLPALDLEGDGTSQQPQQQQ